MKYFTDTTRKTPCHVRLFESPMEMAAAGVSEFAAGKDQDYEKTYIAGNFSDWLSRPVRSSGEYLTLFKGPHRPARERIEAEVARIRREEQIPTPEEVKRVGCWDEEEGEIDMDRAIAGDDECFRHRRKAKRVMTKNVTIVFNGRINWRTTADEALMIGAGVAAAIEVLEDSGYAVELWVVHACTDITEYGHHDLYAGCRVKESGEPLSADIMANCFAPDFFRVPTIGLMSSTPYKVDGDSHGGGDADGTLNLAMQKHMQLDGIKVIQAGCMKGYYTVNNVEQAKRIIREATEA